MRRPSFVPLVILTLAAAPGLVAQTVRISLDVEFRTGFGTAVAVADGEIIAAWPHFTPFTPMMPPMVGGDVLVYRRGAEGWQEAARVSASDGTPDNRFGRALAVRGGRMLMGGTKQDSDLGAAYVFEKDAGGAWHQTAKLLPGDTAGIQNFGRAVALNGDFAFVSTVAHDSARGIVYVFKRGSGGGWTQHATLADAELPPQSYFGLALATDGDLLAVGAPFADGRVGAVYAFRYDGGADAWRRDGRVAGTGATGRLGTDVAVRGGRIVAGAPGLDANQGAAFVYGRDASGTWVEQRRLVAPDGGQGHQFGTAVAVAGDDIWAGAPFAHSAEGRVYRFAAGSGGGTPLDMPGLDPGDIFGNAMAVSGDVAAVAVANDDYGEGSVAVFERQGAAWTLVSTLRTEYAGLDAVAGAKVDCTGGEAASFDCGEVDLLSFMPVQAVGGARGVQVNDVWGWTDPDTGREYALVGRYDGTAFVDVTDPVNPVFLGDLTLHQGARGNVWRDIKVYKNHAFIVSDGAGPHGMQVFDLTQLRDVRNPPARFTETAHYDGIGSSHNVAINEETGFAYAVGVNAGGETCGGGLHMIDIQEPTRPTFAGCFADPNTGNQGTGYSHDAMCIVYNGPDEAHRGKEICFGANENAISIADVTDKANPVALSSATYPTVSYSHQGWITEDHRYFFLDDEGDEIAGTAERTRTLIFDVADLDDPIMVKEHFGTTSASDHNLYIKANLMYQSNYVAGLRVLDISDPENPVEVGYFDTVAGENAPGFDGSWSNYPFFASGTIIVTSGREGLFVLRKSDRLIP